MLDFVIKKCPFPVVIVATLLCFDAFTGEAASHPIVFVGDGSLHAVFEYEGGIMSPKPVAKIRKGIGVPYGLATDAAGTLYVLNQFQSNFPNVTVYPAGTTAPSRTLTIPSCCGYAIAAAPDGTVFVNGEGNVYIYDPGATQPSSEIDAPSQPPNGPVGFGPVAADSRNDLYVGYEGGSRIGNGIAFYPPGSDQFQEYPGTSGAYGAMTFDDRHDLLIADAYSRSPRIRVVSPKGKGTSFNAPAASSLGFDAADGLLYSGFGTVSIIDYASKRVVGSIRGIYDATSIAVSPHPY